MKRDVLPTVITVVAAILGAALAAWGGYVFCTQIKIGESQQLYALIPVYIILILLGAFIDEIVHEGAHFLVGAICGMGVKPPKIRIFKSSSVEVFPKGVKAMRLRFILTAAAGLFFDLLIIALGIIALTVPYVTPILALGLPYAFYSFLINVVPLEYGGGKTDGLVVCEAIANKPSAQVMFAVLKVQGMVNGGLLLKEVPENMLLDVPQIQEDDINFIMLTQLRFEYYESKGNDSEAYKYFLRYKELIRYLPGEYTYGSVTAKRAKIKRIEEEKEEEEAQEETLTLEDIKSKKRKSKKAAQAPEEQVAAEETGGEQQEGTEEEQSDNQPDEKNQ